MLLLLLSHFSHVQLCVTPQMAAHQAPPSLGFSRQEYGVGCHFLLQCMKVKSESEVTQSCPTLHDPMDCSPPGSSIHGIFQARVLEWGAIAFTTAIQAVSCSESLMLDYRNNLNDILFNFLFGTMWLLQWKGKKKKRNVFLFPPLLRMKKIKRTVSRPE